MLRLKVAAVNSLYRNDPAWISRVASTDTPKGHGIPAAVIRMLYRRADLGYYN